MAREKETDELWEADMVVVVRVCRMDVLCLQGSSEDTFTSGHGQAQPYGTPLLYGTSLAGISRCSTLQLTHGE